MKFPTIATGSQKRGPKKTSIGDSRGSKFGIKGSKKDTVKHIEDKVDERR